MAVALRALAGLARRVAACWLALSLAGAAHAAEALDVAQALTLAVQRSGKLGGAAAAVAQSQAQVEANKGLGGPVVSVSTVGYSFDRTQGIDLGAVNNLIGGVQLPIPLPTLPGAVDVRLRESGLGVGVNAVLPLYTGGRIDGVKGVLSGRAAEAKASELQDRDEVQSVLLQRYFGVQAAARVAEVREAARLGIGEHLASARRMEEAGLIARVERLQADAAYEAAVREASKAQHELALAQRALAVMLGDGAAPGQVTPSRTPSQTPVQGPTLATPLFVDTRALEPLSVYLARGDAAHPSLAVVSAKREQTLALNQIEDSVHLPSALAFGRADPKDGKVNWIVGVAINWVLFDGIDRAAVVGAGHAAERRVDEIERQARQDIGLLVERNYRNVDQARVRFLSLRADDALAQEVLRLRRKGLAEGLSTTLDVIDAQLNLSKVQAEQAGAAYEYSQALAALLASTGELDQFAQWAARADIQYR
jgi:outer membrane protein TolC